MLDTSVEPPACVTMIPALISCSRFSLLLECRMKILLAFSALKMRVRAASNSASGSAGSPSAFVTGAVMEIHGGIRTANLEMGLEDL